MRNSAYQIVYGGVWMEYGKQQAKVFPTLYEAICHKHWIEGLSWQCESYWIELSAIRVEIL